MQPACDLSRRCFLGWIGRCTDPAHFAVSGIYTVTTGYDIDDLYDLYYLYDLSIDRDLPGICPPLALFLLEAPKREKLASFETKHYHLLRDYL